MTVQTMNSTLFSASVAMSDIVRAHQHLCTRPPFEIQYFGGGGMILRVIFQMK